MVEYKFEAYSIVGVNIFVAGVLKLYVYYKCFGVSILPFLQPEEILTTFFDNLFYFLIFVALNFIVVSLFYKRNLSSTNFFSNIPIYKRLLIAGFFKLNKVVLFVLLAILMFVISWNRDIESFYEFYFWLALLIVAIYLNPLIYFELRYFMFVNGISVNSKSILLIISAINLFVFSSLSGINESFKVIHKNYYSGTEFELDDKKNILSTKDYYYIGKTNQFMFFYDRINHSADVIPVTRFVKMKFIKK